MAEGEHKKPLEFARIMKSNGASYDKIAQYTGLPLEEIKSL